MGEEFRLREVDVCGSLRRHSPGSDGGVYSTSEGFLLPLPADNEMFALSFLEGLGGNATGAGAGACIIFSIAASGWGLLACGAVGGLAGGVGGSYIGGEVAENWYYTDANTPASELEYISLELPVIPLYTVPPIGLCEP